MLHQNSFTAGQLKGFLLKHIINQKNQTGNYFGLNFFSMIVLHTVNILGKAQISKITSSLHIGFFNEFFLFYQINATSHAN